LNYTQVNFELSLFKRGEILYDLKDKIEKLAIDLLPPMKIGGILWAPIKGGATGRPNPVTPIQPTPCGQDSGL